MATFNPQEVHIPEDGQTDITLSHPYELNKNAVTVYLNGILAILGSDYVEVDQRTIRFNYQLSSDDVVITQQKVYFDDKYVEIISDTDRGLFSRYGSEDRLLKNQRYTVVFDHNGQRLQFSFFTKIHPLFSSLPVVKNDMVDVFDHFEEHKILLQIYLNSVLALNIAGEDQLSEIESAIENNEQIPYYAKQYVRYRTELDMLTAIYMALSGRSGVTEKKKLGELTVDRQNKFSAFMNIEPLLAELKQKLKPWERQLRGSTGSSLFASAVRGGQSNPYPLTSPRQGDWGSGGSTE